MVTPTVVIVVYGGVVQEVFVDAGTNIKVRLIDIDNLTEEGKQGEEIEAVYELETARKNLVDFD